MRTLAQARTVAVAKPCRVRLCSRHETFSFFGRFGPHALCSAVFVDRSDSVEACDGRRSAISTGLAPSRVLDDGQEVAVGVSQPNDFGAVRGCPNSARIMLEIGEAFGCNGVLLQSIDYIA